MAPSTKRQLGSRLASVADRSTLRLTHHGRKSGKAYLVTIWFAVDGDTVYLATMNRDRGWVKNVQQRPEVRLDIGGEHFDGEVTLLNGSKQMLTAYELFAQKYWAMWVLDWVAALTLRNPRHTKKFDAGRGAFLRVTLAKS